MVRKLFFSAILTICAFPAYAFSIAFSQPDGIVGQSDDIDVYITLSATNSLSFDGTDVDGSFGFDPSVLPSGVFVPGSGFVSFDTYTSAITNVGISCSDNGSFTEGNDACLVGSDYEFSFNGSGSAFGERDAFSIMSGESQEFLIGTFSPIDGNAAPGEYNLLDVGFGFTFFGLGTNDAGETVELSSFVNFAGTCASGDQSCDFSRVVVPVPAAVYLFLSALLPLLGVRLGKSAS